MKCDDNAFTFSRTLARKTFTDQEYLKYTVR